MASASDINAAFEKWLEVTQPANGDAHCDRDLRYRRYGWTHAALESESEYLVLYRLETDPHQRGRGSATALLTLLKGICDDYHVTLLAQAAAEDDTGLDQQALLLWYRRHGFAVDPDRAPQSLVWYPNRPGNA